MSDSIYKNTPKVLANALVLTGSLVATEEVDVSNESYVSLFVDYTKGGTALELVVETRPQGDDEWYSETASNSGTPSGGAVSIESVEVTRTITATSKRAITVPCYGASKLRVRVRETGTPSGTVTITAVSSRVGA